jgi:nitrilase
LYCGGEDIHIATWPGAYTEATALVKTISKEGRVWTISASGILSIEDIPTNFALYNELRDDGATQFFNGGSSIIDPCGNYVVGPILDKEQLLIADIDLDIVRQERHSFDPSGHYSRPDVFEFVVNRQRQHRIRYIDSDPGGINK